jgi:hypothetical protein
VDNPPVLSGPRRAVSIPILFAGKYPLNSLKTIEFAGLLAFKPLALNFRLSMCRLPVSRGFLRILLMLNYGIQGAPSVTRGDGEESLSHGR